MFTENFSVYMAPSIRRPMYLFDCYLGCITYRQYNPPFIIIIFCVYLQVMYDCQIAKIAVFSFTFSNPDHNL